MRGCNEGSRGLDGHGMHMRAASGQMTHQNGATMAAKGLPAATDENDCNASFLLG